MDSILNSWKLPIEALVEKNQGSSYGETTRFKIETFQI